MTARPQISVVLNRAPALFHPEEAISGFVVLDAATDCGASAIDVSFGWTARGSAKPWTETVETRRLDGGTWAKGAQVELPFAFIAPAGPESLARDGLVLDWHVMATVVDDTTTTATAQQLLTLQRHPTTPSKTWSLGSAGASLPAHSTGATDKRGWLADVGIGLLVVAIVATVLALGTPSALASASLLLLAIGLAGTGLAGLWWAHRNTVAAQKTGTIVVTPAPLVATPGAALSVGIEFPVLKDLNINRMDVTLQGVAVSLEPHGSVSPRSAREIFEVDQRILDRVGRSAGDAVAMTATFDLPEDVPLSFECPSCAVRWLLKVHIDIPQWPDFVGVWPVSVVPTFVEDGSAEMTGADEDAPRSSAPDLAIPGSSVKTQAPQVESPTLDTLVARIQQAMNPAEREVAIAAGLGQTFDISINVESTTWTSALDADGANETVVGGRTLVGTLVDNDVPVALRLPPADNEWASALAAGTHVQRRAVMRGWNVLFARPELNVCDIGASEPVLSDVG